MNKEKSSGGLLLWVLLILCAVSVSVMAVCLVISGNGRKAEFVPPPFDPAAKSGTPQVESDLGWSEISAEGLEFRAFVCGEVIINDSSADVWFTSAAENNVWLKLRITDSDGRILGETGLIRPGEYVKTVTFTSLPDNGEKIKLKLMSYEPHTYYSAGTVTLNTTATR